MCFSFPILSYLSLLEGTTMLVKDFTEHFAAVRFRAFFSVLREKMVLTFERDSITWKNWTKEWFQKKPFFHTSPTPKEPLEKTKKIVQQANQKKNADKNATCVQSLGVQSRPLVEN